MLEFGAGIYYNSLTMIIIYIACERMGCVIETDIFYDMDTSPELSNTPLLNIRCLSLAFGENQDEAVITHGLQYPPVPVIV